MKLPRLLNVKWWMCHFTAPGAIQDRFWSAVAPNTTKLFNSCIVRKTPADWEKANLTLVSKLPSACNETPRFQANLCFLCDCESLTWVFDTPPTIFVLINQFKVPCELAFSGTEQLTKNVRVHIRTITLGGHLPGCQHMLQGRKGRGGRLPGRIR